MQQEAPLPHLTPKEQKPYPTIASPVFNYLSIAATASLARVLIGHSPISNTLLIFLILVAVPGWILLLKRIIEGIAGCRKDKQ
jgi:hypothetical protein